MALLRLSALALAVAACGQAGAQASAVSSGITPPAGWQLLPEVARAVGEAAKANGVTVAGSEAWGEPARGCYAMWLSLTGRGASAEQVLAGIANEKLQTKDIVMPASEDGLGVLSLGFARRPSAGEGSAAPAPAGYAGRLRARIGKDSVTALACFANEREPLACETACTGLLGGIP